MGNIDYDKISYEIIKVLSEYNVHLNQIEILMEHIKANIGEQKIQPPNS